MLCSLFSLTSDNDGSLRSPTDPMSSVDVILIELRTDVGERSGESAEKEKYNEITSETSMAVLPVLHKLSWQLSDFVKYCRLGHLRGATPESLIPLGEQCPIFELYSLTLSTHFSESKYI